MFDFTLEKQANQFRLTLWDVTPELSRRNDGNFELRLDSDGLDLHIHLSSSTLQTLGLQCAAHLPEFAPKYTVPGVEATYRQPAMILKLYDNRALQCLLRELDSHLLIDFLWYMADADLMLRLLENCSKRAAALLLDELNRRWAGKHPDTAIAHDAKRGRKAVMTLMETVKRLVKEGQLPDLLEDFE